MESRTFLSSSEKRQGRNPTSPELRSNAPQRPLTSEFCTGLSSAPANLPEPSATHAPRGPAAPCWFGLNASAGVSWPVAAEGIAVPRRAVSGSEMLCRLVRFAKGLGFRPRVWKCAL
ncbi:hypothetical protein NN561_011068 [Cricetulus griseus]